MYQTIKKILFYLEPESAHALAETSLKAVDFFGALNLLGQYFLFEDKRLTQELLGTTFKNPVGLAAGFDKNATMLQSLATFGFGHIEYGTLTPKPQIGNDKPRLFRFPQENSLQNAMGFNNHGVLEAIKRLSKVELGNCILGASIGKNKITPNEEALKDYGVMFDELQDFCNYFAINISSPNTVGLRDLQNEEFIRDIFALGIQKTNKPILLKLSPDMDSKEALKLCEVALENGASGIIATNTTTDYSLLKSAKNFGGISGEVLKKKSFEFFKPLGEAFYNKTTLISVGGIDSGKEAYERIKAGASLVQIYSSFIFQGPNLVKKMNQELLTCIKNDGFFNIEEAIGANYK